MISKELKPVIFILLTIFILSGVCYCGMNINVENYDGPELAAAFAAAVAAGDTSLLPNCSISRNHLRTTDHDPHGFDFYYKRTKLKYRKNCPAGTYRVSDTECISCPEGTTSPEGSSDANACIDPTSTTYVHMGGPIKEILYEYKSNFGIKNIWGVHWNYGILTASSRNAMSTLYHDGVKSPLQQCKEQCDKHENCNAISYGNETRGGDRGECRLNNQDGTQLVKGFTTRSSSYLYNIYRKER